MGLDAFAVSVAAGVKICRVSFYQIMRMAGAFGFFQFFMTGLGWVGGGTFSSKLQRVDHWVAFILLMIVGGHMSYSGIKNDHETNYSQDPTRGWLLLSLAVATSIDAFAVGLSFAMLTIPVLIPAVIIGIVALTMTVAGLKLGCKLGVIFGKRMEAVGGLILIFIGIKILWDHLCNMGS